MKTPHDYHSEEKEKAYQLGQRLAELERKWDKLDSMGNQVKAQEALAKDMAKVRADLFLVCHQQVSFIQFTFVETWESAVLGMPSEVSYACQVIPIFFIGELRRTIDAQGMVYNSYEAAQGDAQRLARLAKQLITPQEMWVATTERVGGLLLRIPTKEMLFQLSVAS